MFSKKSPRYRSRSPRRGVRRSRLRRSRLRRSRSPRRGVRQSRLHRSISPRSSGGAADVKFAGLRYLGCSCWWGNSLNEKINNGESCSCDSDCLSNFCKQGTSGLCGNGLIGKQGTCSDSLITYFI